MSLASAHRGATGAGTLCACLLLALPRPALAFGGSQGNETRLVEVPLRTSQFVSIPGVTHVVVLEESICRAELVPDGLRFFGLARGDSVVFTWIGEQQVSLLVRVMVPPSPPVRPSLSRDRVERGGQGQLGTSGQVLLGQSADHLYAFQHQFEWAQRVDGRRVALRGQVIDNTSPGVPWNVSTVSAQYATERSAFTALDFNVMLNGGAEARISNDTPISTFVLRGADALFTRGRNRFEIFGGTTLPEHYRSLRGTRSMAGVNFNRRQSSKLLLYGTTAAISVPEARTGAGQTSRHTNVFHTSGASYRSSDQLAFQLAAGLSTRGLQGDGALTFTSDRVSASAGGTTSSPDFPLNQLQMLSGGGSSAHATTTWKPASSVAASLFYQHSATRGSTLFPSFAGRSDYVNPTVALVLAPSQSATINGVYSRSSGGSTPDETLVKRLDLGWTSQIRARVTNNLQVSAGTFDDEQQINTRVEFGVSDNLSVRLGNSDLSVGFQHNRRDPSLVTRLRQQIGLLPVDLQQLFLSDPVGFAQTGSLPPEVAQTLSALRATDSGVSVSGQFHPTSRLNVGVTYGFLRSSHAFEQRANTQMLGYALTYQVTPTLRIQSSLSDTVYLDSRVKELVRTSVLVMGLTKTFRGGPAWLASDANRREIHGRVFVDRNVDGHDDDSDPGLGGVVVALNNGRRAIADASGRFEFTGLKVGTYEVSIALDQFPEQVRVTTTTKLLVELYERSEAAVTFGLVNFSRVAGTVFNDYALEGVRRADSPGMQNVTVVVTGRDSAAGRRVVTDGSGDYRIDDLSPGSYRLEVDPATIPPQHVAAAGVMTFAVTPTRTVVVDVPMHALRSVTGHVYLIVPATADRPDQPPEPIMGVTVIAGQRQAVTDSTGRFMLRDLPAGDLAVTLKPARPLPSNITAPVGLLRMPNEAVQVEDAVIVILNRELLQYLILN